MGTIERFQSGFELFKTEVYDKKPDLFGPLKEGQSPKVSLNAATTVVLNFQPGEAFTIRNIANTIPPYDPADILAQFSLSCDLRVLSFFMFDSSSVQVKYGGTGAAIEYPVVHLKEEDDDKSKLDGAVQVENVIVIGHSRCGGIKALLSTKDDGSTSTAFIEDWVKVSLPAKKKVEEEHASLPLEEKLTIAEKEAVNSSLANLKTYPFVTEAIEKGALKLFGAHYDFVNGKFEIWEA
ncbi:hypothetical protein ZIOFF_047069 [Zingiber officinale]|uniref:Carbonic anhydrase n=1 Tax=Zingiber officinale TaxID=94328 RepID=A0A8J5FQ96_ZINOF|nr:hypothetical protein ZIOFF_047069 [Zingiber officinale]